MLTIVTTAKKSVAIRNATSSGASLRERIAHYTVIPRPTDARICAAFLYTDATYRAGIE